MKVAGVRAGLFEPSWKLYKSAFPFQERRELDRQSLIFKDKHYAFYAVLDGRGLVGLVTAWDFAEFALVEHLAVKKNFRRLGKGSEIMRKFMRKKQRVVVEVERPTDLETRTRIKFYEKLGFVLDKHPYIQPPYGKGKQSVAMRLMTFPKGIGGDEFRRIREILHRRVYGLKRAMVDAKAGVG